MKKYLSTILCTLSLLSISVPSTFAQSSARVIMDECIASMDGLRTLKARLKRTERLNGKYEHGEMEFKLNISPQKVYIYNHAPDDGAEVIWCEGVNDNKALVNPNKFPLGLLNLNIRGKILTKGQHHNLESVGFSKISRIVKAALQQYGSDFDKYVVHKGTTTWNGHSCDIIEINYTDFGYEQYTVKPGEDLWSICRRKNLPEYRITELNPGVKNYTDVSAGQTIKLPNVYAPKTVFYIDKKSKLPIVQMIYDEDGLYEKYEYVYVVKNPKFEPIEFMPANPKYGFM